MNTTHFQKLDALRVYVPLRSLMLKHRFFSFFALLMLIQQICITYSQFGLLGYGIVMKLEMLGPLIAALLMIWLQHGTSRAKATLGKLFLWRVSPIWYFHAIFWLPLAAFVGIIIRNLWTGAPIFAFPTYWEVFPNTGFLNFLAVMVLAVSEELGWFGYGFAILYARYNAFTAATIVGLFWGISYIPMWQNDMWIAPGQPLWTVIVAYIAWAYVCVWIYNSTRSAFLLALMQIASNYSYSVLVVLPHITGETLTLSIVTVVLLLAGLLVVGFYGPTHMSAATLSYRGEWDRSLAQIPTKINPSVRN